VTLLDDIDPAEGYFDAAQGLYWYAADYHEGQSSLLYSILSSRLGYRPAPSESCPDPDSIAEWFYDALVAGEVDAEDVLAFVETGYEATREG
jgi:hypothetical protein